MSGEGWQAAPLESRILRIEGGRSPDLPDSPAAPGEWGVLKVSAVHTSGFRPAENKRVTHPSLIDERYEVQVGDLLISRANTPELVGSACIAVASPSRLLLSDKTLRVVVDRTLTDPEYVALCLSSSVVRLQVENAASGSSRSMQNISQRAIEKLMLPWPPVFVQRRIVETIRAISSMESSIEASIEKIRTIRSEASRTLMHPVGWSHGAIGEFASVGSGGTPSRKRAEFWISGSIPWVRTAEIVFSDISATSEMVTPLAIEEANLKIYPRGTVLVAMYGEGVTRGRSAVLATEATVNQAVAAIACDPNRLDYQYLYYWLEGNYAEIRKIGHGSNQTNLNASLVESVRLPVPPLDEQRRIVDRLKSFDDFLTADVEELAKLRSLRGALTDDLLSGRSW